ncbi:MAG: hypothetical protein ACR2HG_03605 [Pyrinomonadaceae bacterium]
MEKKYKILTIIFAAIALVSIAGFYKTYFALFPTFRGLHSFTHIHLAVFLCWFVLLIWQPILIRQKKYELHRKIGQLSYVLAPLMFITILGMVAVNFPGNFANNQEQAYAAATGAILGAVFFITYYLISMFNKRNMRWHVAFILAASVTILDAGLGRLASNLTSQGTGILVEIFTPYLIAISILLYEKLKLQRAILKSPYFLFSLLWTLHVALFVILSANAFWQTLLNKVLIG